MRIIHCADIHLDSALNAHLGRESAKSRRNEILNTFRKMFVYAEKKDVQAIIIAGDLFDSEMVSATTINVVLGEIAKHTDIDVFYLRGNHDPDDSLFVGRRLPENLYLFGEEWTQYQLKGTHIVIAGAVLSDENCNSIYDELELDEHDINIVTFHGQEQEYGKARNMNDVCLKRLRGRGIDYLALGHVHGRKLESLDHRGVYCYPGCLEGRGFDECGEHGFVVLDVDERKHMVEAEFVPFAYRRLFDVEVNVTGAKSSSDAADMIADRLYQELPVTMEDESRDMVRVSLTGEVDVESEINADYLTKQFQDSFYYMEIVDHTEFQVDYTMYINDASLKGEFVRKVMEQEMSEADRAYVIQTGLKALAGEEIF